MGAGSEVLPPTPAQNNFLTSLMQDGDMGERRDAQQQILSCDIILRIFT